jgi:hypothetical protein
VLWIPIFHALLGSRRKPEPTYHSHSPAAGYPNLQLAPASISFDLIWGCGWFGKSGKDLPGYLESGGPDPAIFGVQVLARYRRCVDHARLGFVPISAAPPSAAGQAVVQSQDGGGLEPRE